METHLVFGAVAVGLGATLLVDIWNGFLRRAFGIRSLDYCYLGRWLGHMTQGTFTHARIADARAMPFECALGWITHYSIGVVLTLAFVVLIGGGWLEDPTFLPALLYGIGTVLFPLFILQPAFGLGLASSKTPNPAQARLKSLMTHTVFGVGVWMCAIGVGALMRAFY